MLTDRSFSELFHDEEDLSPPASRPAEAPRVAFETDVSIGGGGRVFSGVSIDVSVDGIFVAVYRALSTDTRVSLRFRLPTGYVMATGTVRGVREGRPGVMPGLRIAFTDLEDADKTSLERFCGTAPSASCRVRIGTGAVSGRSTPTSPALPRRSRA